MIPFSQPANANPLVPPHPQMGTSRFKRIRRIIRIMSAYTIVNLLMILLSIRYSVLRGIVACNTALIIACVYVLLHANPSAVKEVAFDTGLSRVTPVSTSVVDFVCHVAPIIVIATWFRYVTPIVMLIPPLAFVIYLFAVDVDRVYGVDVKGLFTLDIIAAITIVYCTAIAGGIVSVTCMSR